MTCHYINLSCLNKYFLIVTNILACFIRPDSLTVELWFTLQESFTGSTEVKCLIMKNATMSNLKQVLLELDELLLKWISSYPWNHHFSHIYPFQLYLSKLMDLMFFGLWLEYALQVCLTGRYMHKYVCI